MPDRLHVLKLRLAPDELADLDRAVRRRGGTRGRVAREVLLAALRDPVAEPAPTRDRARHATGTTCI